MALLNANNNPDVVAVLVSVDRMERGQGELSAIDEAAQQFRLPVFAIVTIKDIIAHLHNRPLDGHVCIDDPTKERIDTYLNRYGA